MTSLFLEYKENVRPTSAEIAEDQIRRARCEPNNQVVTHN